jgi:hypothetical protein
MRSLAAVSDVGGAAGAEGVEGARSVLQAEVTSPSRRAVRRNVFFIFLLFVRAKIGAFVYLDQVGHINQELDSCVYLLYLCRSR